MRRVYGAATWRRHRFERLDRHRYQYRLDIPADHHVGLFGEISYGAGGIFSTQTQIVGPDPN